MPTAAYAATDRMLGELKLNTVCREARCPNIFECYNRKTATFMILGSTCTRNCRFCAIAGGRPDPLDPGEPERVAEAARRLGLKHVVITSITRDDLADGGAELFAETINAVRAACGCTVEVLTPDFQGDESAIRTVMNARPDVYNHNVETVPRLYPEVRPEADYERSLGLLELVKKEGEGIITKSGIMLGLGETEGEVEETLSDLVEHGCRVVTIGQYLAPSAAHHPVEKFYTPEEFEKWGVRALAAGFRFAPSGPFVRSSYRAEEIFGNADVGK